MSGSDHLRVDTAVGGASGLPSAASSRPTPVSNLTTFPNPFQDEPETGLLPSLLSKVKSTFSAPAAPAPRATSGDQPSAPAPAQTEAQAIAEAARKLQAVQAQQATSQNAPPKPSQSQPQAQPAQPGSTTISARRGNAQQQLKLPSTGDPIPAPLLSPTPVDAASGTPGLPAPKRTHSHQPSVTGSVLSSAAPSVSSSASQQPRRHLVPGERNWRPSGAAPAQVTVSQVTSVTTTAPRDDVPHPYSRFPSMPPSVEVTSARGKSISGAAVLGGGRLRRGSIGTIPDSPSSVSLSAMISSNAELSQNNYSFVPGFSLPAEDTRSVRSLAFVKRPHSVSKIIRRMRGEGLSKHYWMADENCKECYDCKSAFSTWRRKHHCRICGQIFCGRCASNIIGARRFGQDGMVRVCNLCLKIMEDYDDEDDRRSIHSGMSNLPDRVISPEVGYAHSPYAANHLYGRGANESLSAIEEHHWPNDRPFTPDDSDNSDSDEDHHWNRAKPSTAAPFRRHGDDNSDGNHTPHNSSGLGSPADVSSPHGHNEVVLGRRHAEFPFEKPHIAFPDSPAVDSDDGRDGSNGIAADLRARLLSEGGRANGLNALLDTDRKDGLWRARSHSFVTPNEFLTGPSLAHFNNMLQQSIERHELANPAQWHGVLSRLLLRVSTNLRPVVRAGDSIDPRTYVKIKKVPGGKITDSEYVDGIVITKNVAHKGMQRRLVNPRIMVITFPLDYHRVETQFMSLDPIMKQERDYLRLLTKRIIDLRPHIVLVERFVSRIALDFLFQANIVVARGLKPAAIHQVARCTHADIIGSMDKLALEPRLGRCADFKVQTFEHELIPGRRKTYMRFEGTHNGFGGTVILRGGDIPTLRKAKGIADFLALVAYHLKNEAFLYHDEFQMPPPYPPLPTQYRELLEMLRPEHKGVYGTPVAADGGVSPDENATPKHKPDDMPKVGKELERESAMQLTREIGESLEPYLTTVLSASVAVRFPPPHPLARMVRLDRLLKQLRDHRDEKEEAKILSEEKRVPEKVEPLKIIIQSDETVDSPHESGDSKTTDHPPVAKTTDSAKITDSSQSAPVSAAPSVDVSVAPTPSTPKSISSLPTVSAAAAPAPSTTAPAPAAPVSNAVVPATTAPTPSTSSSQILSGPLKGDPYRILLKPQDFVEASTLASVEYDHARQLKLWDHYVRRNPGPLLPKNFQGIIYLQALYRQGQEKPCEEPTRRQINFYQDDDQTLGQFLNSMVSNAAHRCKNKACEQLMLFHYDVLVHHDRRLQIVMEQFMCPLAGHEEQILTWSYCRVCNRSWEPSVIRDETWRISWGTYLEHCFYPPETRTGFGCSHDAYREHIRYFAHHNMVIRIHNDAIDLYEPVRPSIKLLNRIEDKVELKNKEYESALQKTAAFFDSVLHRLRSFTDDLVEPEKQALMRHDRDQLLTRAVADRDEMVNALNRTYKQTPPTDVLAINVVLQTLQDKVIQWDLDFLDVEKLYMPTEKDLKRMTATHLKRLFATHDVFGSLDKNMASISVPEVDEREKGVEETTTDPESSLPSKQASPILAPAEGESVVAVDSPMALESPMPQGDSHLALDVPPEGSLPSPTVATDSGNTDTTTPTPTLSRVDGENTFALMMSTPRAQEIPRGYESDSTISAMPRSIPTREEIPSSGMDSDVQTPFVSRLPRKKAHSPSVADLVQRFQDPNAEAGPSVERSRSGAGTRRPPRQESEVSDSDVGMRPVRPRMRRARHTEQAVPRYRDPKTNLQSDSDRSYAKNASRVSHPGTKRATTAEGSSGIRGRGPRAPSRAGSRAPSRVPSPTRAPSPVQGRLAHTQSPAPGHRSTRDGHLAAPTPRLPIMKTISLDGKPRLGGKGKTPRKATSPAPNLTAPPAGGLIRGLPRRVVGAGTRVTSIARHFDKISREAERDRQKRISMARGKRAGRVGVTKAKVQVFNTLRDAFKDEFDSDSSAADNEADDGDASDVSMDSTGRPKPKRKVSSPSASRPLLLPPSLDVPPTPPPKKLANADADAEDEISARETGPIEEAEPDVKPEPAPSESGRDGNLNKDRLHIELAPFDTNAPLPRIPPTPMPAGGATDLEDRKKDISQLSQVSESEMSSGGVERSSILKTLTGLWAIRAGDFTPLDYPLSAAEHIFVDSRVIVRENEPTSIIAFTLSSKQYREQMRSVLAASKARRQSRHEPSMLDGKLTASDRQWDIISVDEALETDDGGAQREGGTHLKYDFESGSSTISCRIFFAEQFAALRQACQCEDGFIESLARCAKFDASGGKSGSAFLKTKDDRFIVKEISRYEMDALTKFAPAYFEYTTASFTRDRPSALAKTYGIFKIGYRNAVTGRSMHMNILVQENLFYGGSFAKIYDLKGSTRNRLIKPTGRINEVLLDENLMEVSNTAPLYLRDHSKRILRTALWNDTLFLSNLNVMDYSLVVGVDAERKELVVGVVDYIRTFTWDKKVESWVKDFGGGGRGEPTIVTPLQYRKRFRTAMDKYYFPAVPDRWSVAGTEETGEGEEVVAS